MLPHWFRFRLEDVNLFGSEQPQGSEQSIQVISLIMHHVVVVKYT